MTRSRRVGTRRDNVCRAEHDLAERFAVSRGTVRAALADLADEEYIAIHGGIGSIVTFDGAALDPRSGWARSLAATGTEIAVRVLRIERVSRPGQAQLGLDDPDFIAVDRVRHVVGGPDVSLERSLVPPFGRLARAVDEGLVDDSLTATIASAGLVPALAEQWVDLQPLTAEEAASLHRTVGEPFLHSRRVSRTADGTFVEAVDSLLDPSRFRLHMKFGSAS